MTTLDTKVSEFDLKGISDQATNTLSDIDGLVSDQKLKIAIANVADASAELKDLVAAVDKDEVNLAVTNAGAAIEQIKLAAGNLAEITTPDAATAIRLNRTLASLEEAGRSVEELADYLSYDEIVTQGPQNDLNLAPFHVWGESLEKGITRVVAEDLSELLDTPTVVPFPDADARYDYRASIIIRRFEMAADGQVRLNASYSIVGKPGSDRTGSARSREYIATVAEPDNYASVVDAMSQALTNLSKSIARDILTLSRAD